jgi:hypothetical protein
MITEFNGSYSIIFVKGGNSFLNFTPFIRFLNKTYSLITLELPLNTRDVIFEKG